MTHLLVFQPSKRSTISSMSRSLFIGADHRGFALKAELHEWLSLLSGWMVTDLGNTVLDPDDDFTQFAFAVAESVRDTAGSRGVLICHSAVGMCIAANKVVGIRAGQGISVEQVAEDRQHNDFQVLCLSSDQTVSEAQPLIQAFLQTEFNPTEEYSRRVAQISAYEQRK